MGDKLDRTTGLNAIVDRQPGGSWYLIVALDDQRNTRVVQLDDGAELVFGRSAEASVVIDHDAVSRKHTVVRRRGEAIVVQDLGSRNGTTINGALLQGVRRAAAGDVIGVGPVTAIVARSSASRGRQLATMTELEDRLEIEVDRALRYQRRLGVVMLRLEGPGDAVIAHVDRLLREARRMDLIAEYGPDELAIVVPECDPAELAALAAHASAGDGVTAQCGTASFPEDGSNAGALVGAA
ncbi:MAG TPA: FHA domain-containing protein, partial [Kofleriaceae bacterium]